MKKMSKTKLTYITPVLDFVQAESEGLLLVDGSGEHQGVQNRGLREIGTQEPKTSTSSSTTPMQISSTLTDSQQRVTTNSSSERARDNKNGGKRRNYNSLQLLNINRKQWNKHYWITLTGLKKKHAKRS